MKAKIQSVIDSSVKDEFICHVCEEKGQNGVKPDQNLKMP